MSDKPKKVDPKLAYTNPLALTGKPIEAAVPTTQVVTDRKLQSRVDVDHGYDVDTKRAETFAEKMKAGAKFPPIKVVECTDAPGEAGKTVYVVWDGHHTNAAHEINRSKTVNALVWKGTFAQAVAAAASEANKEHENNGKPKSYRDKIRSLTMYADALKRAQVPKSQWPSNRQAAAMFGVSHTAVGDEDPFERRAADSQTPDQKKAKKKAERAAAAPAPAPAGTAPAPAGDAPLYEIVQKTTAQPVATIAADGPAQALEKFKEQKPHEELKNFVAREKVTDAPKAGAPKAVGFDWEKIKSDLGSAVRGLEAAKDLYDLKGHDQYKDAMARLNNLFKNVDELKKFAKDKAKAAK